jgi:DNA-binding CsgD family transcriptional regulator
MESGGVMYGHTQDGSSNRALQITPRERDALRLLANGRTTNDVAVTLGISRPDTATLLAQLFAAMGASTQADAIAAAHRRGLLTCEPATSNDSPADSPLCSPKRESRTRLPQPHNGLGAQSAPKGDWQPAKGDGDIKGRSPLAG